MDPAPDFSFIIPEKEGAGRQRPSLRVDPVVDPDYSGKIRTREIAAVQAPAVPEPYCNVPENILPVVLKPGQEIFRDTLLAPSPFLAAPAALPAVLFHNPDSPEQYWHFSY